MHDQLQHDRIRRECIKDLQNDLVASILLVMATHFLYDKQMIGSDSSKDIRTCT